jgi:hypothetical protein
VPRKKSGALAVSADGGIEPPSEQSRRGFDWLNFFMSDVQEGFGSLVSFYLAHLPQVEGEGRLCPDRPPMRGHLGVDRGEESDTIDAAGRIGAYSDARSLTRGGR